MIDKIIALVGKYWYVFVEGLGGTLWLSFISVAAATVVGALLAIMRLSKYKALHFIVNAFLSVIRGTPILLQLYFFWLWLPTIVPFEMTDTNCIVVALIINASAYVTEVIRSGIQAVDIGQTEAAKSLGMSGYNTMMRIVLPQAIKNILPAMGNQYIMMVKQTSLASVFFINDLMTSYRTVASATYQYLPSLAIVGIVYYLLTTVMTYGVNVLERRMKRSDR